MNSSVDFDAAWVNSLRINTSAVQRRAKSLPARRSFKKKEQAVAYMHAVACLDLTTLNPDDTPSRVRRLCAKALRPVSESVLDAVSKKFELKRFNLTTGAVCVYHSMVKTAADYLQGRLPVAAVSTGFPDGQTPIGSKIKEIEQSIDAGATEIDIVISRGLALQGKWKQLYEEIKYFREVCGERAHMKTILGVGNLGPLVNVARASAVALMAGSDFIKTSTGREATNATLENSLVMVRQIREFHDNYKRMVGFKPAGGIGKAKDAMSWLILMKEELNNCWTKPELFRFGASSLLKDLERQLDHLGTGQYSAGYRHAMA